MKRGAVIAGLTVGAIGAGVWARQRWGPAWAPALGGEASQVPLVIPGRVAVERVLGEETSSPLPLVLVLHGVAADETQLGPYVLTDRPVRVVFLRGGVGMKSGHQWFPARFKGEAPALISQLYRAAAEVTTVLQTIASQRPIGRRIVLGYSQGAHLAWWLAASGVVDAAIAVSGALPPSLRPPPARRPVSIEAIHGTRDPVIPYSAAQATARAFEAAGYRVKLTPVRLTGHGLASIGHAIAPALRAALGAGASDSKERRP